MTQYRLINATQVSHGFITAFVIINLLAVWAQQPGTWVAKTILFAGLTFLPGLALLRAMRIVPRLFCLGLLYSFGLSLLVLMLSGLLANQLLPFLGVARPLSFPSTIWAWDLVTAGIIAGSLFNRLPVRIRRPSPSMNTTGWWLLGLSCLLPLGAALGAFYLNNGGGPLLSELTLIFAACLIAYTVLLRRRLPDGLLAWFIFILGFSILLMTSLRSMDIIGHDIEREFRVYSLTHAHGLWNIGLYRDPYNACLSITILPEMIASILHVSGLVVFKLIMQATFAACGVMVFVLLRRYVPKLAALAGSLLFLCYPTFINDSAMLTRQGVAYLFFALALLVASNTTQKTRCKLLFLFCALGAILSHYSTAYMFTGLFMAAVVCKLCMTWWLGRTKPTLRYKNSSSVLSFPFAALLLLMTFMWYTQITATSQGLGATLASSLTKLPAMFSNDNKSGDTSAALLFSSRQTQADLYQAYLSKGQNGVTDIQQSELPTLTSDTLPLTQLGEKARAAGLNPAVIPALRQYFAKLLQLLAVASVGFAVYTLLKRKAHALGLDFICLSIAALVMLALMVTLPVLSVNYGLLRAFQQALIFLIVPMMLFLMWVTARLRPAAKSALVAVLLVPLFLLFTNVFAQLLGGTPAALTLNNQGLYYGLYFSSAMDQRSFLWLKKHVASDADVRAANFNRALMHDPTYPFSRTGVLPTQLHSDTYVYLDQAQLKDQKLYVYYQGTPLTMTFPLTYFDTAKDRIYSTGTGEVYR